uniref:Fibrinogen C-terminal domain-containing protein n=1 Tax=Macrostomum lignano TaxID=282301 RepID=A0A1I8F355_9PLAT
SETGGRARESIADYEAVSSQPAATEVDCLAAAVGDSAVQLWRSTPVPAGAPASAIVVFQTTSTKCWTTVQRRVSDSVDFYRNWSQYQTGFGDGPDGNYWIETRNFVTSSKIMTLNIASLPVGLNTLHALTQSRSRKLLILMRQWDDSQDWAEYSSFSVGSESDNYRLTVSRHSTLITMRELEATAAKRFIGAWWYKSCFESHLNGPYKNYSEAIGGPFAIGIIWRYNYGFHYSLKEVEMLVLLAHLVSGGFLSFQRQPPTLSPEWVPAASTEVDCLAAAVGDSAVQLVAFNVSSGWCTASGCRLGLSHCRKCRNADKGAQRVVPMASNRSNKPAVDDTVPPASAGAVDSSAIPPATIGDASARPVEPTLSGASEKTPATPAAKKRSTTSGAARRRLNKARRAKEGGSQTGARGQRPAAAEASQSGAVAEEGLEPTEAPAQDREADAAGEESSTDPRASYADAAKRQPAVVILGKDARLSPDQLKQVRSAVDGLLWKQTLKGTPLNIHSNATRDSCLLIWPSDADSGRRLLELLPEQSWDLNLAFCREDERPRTKRHRIWVPARSVVTSADELRKGLLAVNRELPAAGLVVHDTLKRTDGTGFTAILGLSDAWMRRYPHGSFINVGLWKLRIRSYEADPPRGSEQGGRDAEAAGPRRKPLLRLPKQTALPGSTAARAKLSALLRAEATDARRAAPSGAACTSVLRQSLRREVAGTPRRTSSSGGGTSSWAQPSGRLETDLPRRLAPGHWANLRRRTPWMVGKGRRTLPTSGQSGPFAEEEPMDTGDPDPKPSTPSTAWRGGVVLMRTAEQQLPGLVFVQEPWMTKVTGWRVWDEDSLSDHRFIRFCIGPTKQKPKVTWSRNVRTPPWLEAEPRPSGSCPPVTSLTARAFWDERSVGQTNVALDSQSRKPQQSCLPTNCSGPLSPSPLYGKNISMEKQVRCLGLTLDHRLNWTPHIQTKAKKALAVLAQIRRAVGTTWGLTPRKLWWIYTAIIRPSISYASLVWASGLSERRRRAPGVFWMLGVAFKKVRAFKKRSLIPHSDLCLKALEECGGLNILTDSIPATLLLSQRYKVTIQPRHEASDSWSDSEVHCYTDGSMRHGLSGFGACVFFKGEVVWSYSQHTGLNSSVFQSEVLAISSCAAELRRRQLSGRKFIFHSDSQAALRALCRSTASS